MADNEKEIAQSGTQVTVSAKTAAASETNETGIGDDLSTPTEQHSDFPEISAKEERAFVWRLDLGLLVVGFLGYTFKYLDQTNIVRTSTIRPLEIHPFYLHHTEQCLCVWNADRAQSRRK